MTQISLDSAVDQDRQNVLSVEDLNRHIRSVIEGQVGIVWVRGEVSNFKAHTSGHYYFSLKDAQSQIRAVMFRGSNARLKFRPKDGDEVIVRGKISVYEPRGDYQIVCDMMEPVGAGALQKAFEDLKLKLKQEGLFEATRKRALPKHPRHVALVTSPTGAAIQDMLNVLSRRNRSVQITLVPTQVQGEAAAFHIIKAMNLAYQLRDLDAIIVGRGGGSIEDLWAFNDENLARTIASSPVPVISAVGHEIDFTIADFVADVRAATPSAAAELVAQSSEDVFNRINSHTQLLKVLVKKVLHSNKQAIAHLSAKLVDPKRKLQDLVMRNDELLTRLQNSVSRFLHNKGMQLKLNNQRLGTPSDLLQKKSIYVRSQVERLQHLAVRNLEKVKNRFIQGVAILDSLSPLKVVSRGYSLVYKKSELVKSFKQVKVSDEIRIKLMEGQVVATVTNAQHQPFSGGKNGI